MGDCRVAFVPQPDDAAFCLSGTLAQCACSGWTVRIVITTDSRKGPLTHAQAGWAPHSVVDKLCCDAAPHHVKHVQDPHDTLAVKTAAIAEHRTRVDFLVEDLQSRVRHSVLDPAAFLGEGTTDPRQVVAKAIETQATAIGATIGAPFAEAFRAVLFHPMIEGLLKSQATT
jgi:LmbE family N-acetylglucosaminyl deacetylase